MSGVDIEIAAPQEAKNVAFLKDPSKSTAERLQNAKDEFMLTADHANPFETHTVGLFSSPLRSLKTIILLPVVVVRAIGLLFCLIVVVLLFTIAIKVSCIPTPKLKPDDVAPVKVPCRFWLFIKPAQIFMRGVLFFCGYHWVSETGRPAPKSEAPLITPNHISWVETFYLTTRLLCSGMSKYENLKEPVIGSVLTALQFVIVDRDDAESRKASGAMMEAHLKDPDSLQFLIFPEGLCHNGKNLIQWKDGPFRAGLPVQPVFLNYPFDRYCSGYDPTLPVDGRGTVQHVFRCLFEFHNPLHVTWLDVYKPSEEERKDSILYARNVRAYMSVKAGVPCTEHTMDDIRMMRYAYRDLKIRDDHWAAFEVQRAKEQLHINLEDGKKILQRFENIDTDKTGKVDVGKFLSALNLPRTPLTEKVFELYDVNGDGEINFREYLCAHAMLRGISRDPNLRHEEEDAVVGSPLHPESLDFAWQLLTGGAKDRIEYVDIKNVFERYAMPTGTGTEIKRLFDTAKGDQPAMDRAAFNALMSSAPEYMQLLRLGEQQKRSGSRTV